MDTERSLPERADSTERSLPERADSTERSLPERADSTERSLPERANCTDLLGRPTTADEDAVLEVYDALRALVRTDLPPCAAAGLRTALASVAVVVTDLGLRFEHLLDEGV
jgi:hypothetical protein